MIKCAIVERPRLFDFSDAVQRKNRAIDLIRGARLTGSLGLDGRPERPLPAPRLGPSSHKSVNASLHSFRRLSSVGDAAARLMPDRAGPVPRSRTEPRLSICSCRQQNSCGCPIPERRSNKVDRRADLCVITRYRCFVQLSPRERFRSRARSSSKLLRANEESAKTLSLAFSRLHAA
jgi:hypothetical protein